jgi:hypothetical protein
MRSVIDAGRLLALVVPSAGRPWILSTTGSELAELLDLTGPDAPELVRQARQVGTELHLCATHAELPRWYATALANDLVVEAGLVLDQFRLHVPGAWRPSELNVAMLHAIQDLYQSPELPVIMVDTERGRTTVVCRVWEDVAGNLIRSSSIKVVSPVEVQRAMRALSGRQPWYTGGTFTAPPIEVWLAISVNLPQRRRTVYVPAPEPVVIDPRGMLRAPSPAQFVVSLTVQGVGSAPMRSLPLLGPFTTVLQADAAHDKAHAVVDHFGWSGMVATQAAILPGRLTMAGQIARHLSRLEHV